MKTLGTVGRLRSALRSAKVRGDTRPGDYVAWTPPQVALLEYDGDRGLLRTGNQIGKTWSLAYDLDCRARGSHPFKTVRSPPVMITVVTSTWRQSIAFQTKLWELCSRDAIIEETEFDRVRGFRGTQTALQYKNGSIIRIKTGKQGGLALAAETVDVVAIDEPLENERNLHELERRLVRRGGVMLQTMTPINARVDYVREMSEKGQIDDMHFTMTPDVFTPVGWDEPLTLPDGTPLDATWIKKQRALVHPAEEPVVIDGEWETRATENMFPGFDETKHVVPDLFHSDIAPQGEVHLSLGIDYADERLRTCAILTYYDIHPVTGYPRLYVVGEYVPTSSSSTDMDARGILSMLASLGDRWTDLDYAWGDKPYTDQKGRVIRKSNAQLMEAIEKELKISRGLNPKINSTKRGGGGSAGSVWRGIRWLHDTMIREGHLYIDRSRCPWLIECINSWDGRKKSIYKDAIDGWRYGLKHLIFPQKTYAPRTLLR